MLTILYIIALIMLSALVIITINFAREVFVNTINDITDILLRVVAIAIIVSEVGMLIITVVELIGTLA